MLTLKVDSPDSAQIRRSCIYLFETKRLRALLLPKIRYAKPSPKYKCLDCNGICRPPSDKLKRADCGHTITREESGRLYSTTEPRLKLPNREAQGNAVRSRGLREHKRKSPKPRLLCHQLFGKEHFQDENSDRYTLRRVRWDSGGHDVVVVCKSPRDKRSTVRRVSRNVS